MAPSARDPLWAVSRVRVAIIGLGLVERWQRLLGGLSRSHVRLGIGIIELSGIIDAAVGLDRSWLFNGNGLNLRLRLSHVPGDQEPRIFVKNVKLGNKPAGEKTDLAIRKLDPDFHARTYQSHGLVSGTRRSSGGKELGAKGMSRSMGNLPCLPTSPGCPCCER